jgi:polysaccharide biosynthesis transport protein
MKNPPQPIASQSMGSNLAASPLDQVDLQQYWLVLKRRWKPASLVFLSTIAAAAGLASLQKSTYSSSGKLLFRANRMPALTGLGNESSGSGSQAGNIGTLGQLTQQSSPLRTETESLLSRPILERTIRALNLRDAKGKAMDPDDLAKQVKVKDVAGADVLKVSYTDRNAQRASAVINQLMQEYIKTNIATTRSEATAAREFIAQELPKTEAVLRQADAAVREFKERSGITDFTSEERLLSTALGDIETQITRGRTELTEVSSRYGALQGKLGMGTAQALTAGTLSQSVEVQQALSQWQQLQSQLQLERTKLKDNHPRVQDLIQKEAALRQIVQQRVVQTVGSNGSQASMAGQGISMGEIKQTLIKEYIGSEISRSGVANRLNALDSARIVYRQRLSLLPRIEQQQRELQRRVEVAQGTYASLLKRLQEVQLAERQTVGTARMIEQAVPALEPSGSNKIVLLGVGALLGSLLASATMLGLEVADRSIKTVKEARDVFGYPWLGTIPYWGNPAKAKRQMGMVPTVPVRDMPRSLVSGAYRMLQANLRFLNLDGNLKSVVITSSVPKEGKSTIAANLAATMAQLGRRTLLIDADLHHPTQHRTWDLPNQAGLSDIIIGQTNFKTAVQQSVMDHLDVLTAGTMPPNPLAILDSNRMAMLIESLEQTYDFVIIDAPPLMVEAEALTLGRLAHGVLLVARPGLVPTDGAKMAKELLTQSGQRVLGLVVNSAVLEPDAYRNAYYDREAYNNKSSDHDNDHHNGGQNAKSRSDRNASIAVGASGG